MRDLQKVAKECMKELDKIGIQYGKVKEFSVNTRAKKRWGQCKTVPGGFTINIAACLLDETTDIKGLKNTIIHELLHTCKGCLNHGAEWKRLAAKVNRAYGYGIKRTSSADEKGCTCRETGTVRHIKHKLVCKNCGHVFVRYRESKLTKMPDHFLCGCGGTIEKIF